MCELFAASMRYASRVSMSLHTFAERGGRTGKHRDGWGIACYDGPDCTVLREPRPAADSALASSMAEPGLRSNLFAHIRLATSGAVALRNTHPFARELGGRVHVLAHNGNLAGVRAHPRLALGHARPVGETDSEYFFCCLLAVIRPLWANGRTIPSVAARLDVVRSLAAAVAELGPANFIYADADILFAHGHRRTQASGAVEPPGLWVLQRQCGLDPDATAAPGLSIDSSEPQQVTLLASVPLTDEDWRPLAEGEVLAVRGGRTVA